MLTAAFSLTDGGAATKSVTYGYDASGSRILREAWDGTNTTTERYGLDGGDPAKPRPLGNENKDPWVTLDEFNALVSRWSFGTGFAEVVARQTAAGTLTWDLADRQQSVRMVIDNSANVLATAAFDAYGKLLAGGTIYDGFGYTGEKRDEVTLLYSNGKGTREYLSDIGRWMQADPRWPLTGEPNPSCMCSTHPPTPSTPAATN
jgi:RHS repeat-associated protein